MSKPRLLVVFGGRSSEHEISIRSATSVIDAVDHERWEVVLLGIRRDGQWTTGPTGTPLSAVLADGESVLDLGGLTPDVVFPVLHGPYGEDGTFQGLLELSGLAYVGSGVLGSALCMDKAVQKHVVAAAAPEIPLVPWLELSADDVDDDQRRASLLGEVAQRLAFPCFVKPANMGSSVGVSAVRSAAELDPALREATRYDRKIVIERGIDAREIEVAILGNGGPETIASRPGEIGLPSGTWYDYETKYIDDIATLAIPAELPENVTQRIRDLALRAFRVCQCRGLARVDFLLERGSMQPYLNELNTMPGFTSISMYPKLMEDVGIGFPELIDRLCQLALDHHASRRRLRSDR